MRGINLAKYKIHTDLVIEDDARLVDSKNESGTTVIHKYKDGNYITISFNDITDSDNFNAVLKVFYNELKRILDMNKIDEFASLLVIGLGNRMSTPDSLGVRVADKIEVTRHIQLISKLEDGIRVVSKIAPSVMGETGIESGDIILSVVEKIKPDFIIAIDALSAMDIKRINKTIQITDTGIHPGSGIGNWRMEVSKKTVGIPVIGIGVPTVVSAGVLVVDTLNYLYRHIKYVTDNMAISKLSYYNFNYRNKLDQLKIGFDERSSVLGNLGTLKDSEVYDLVMEVLNKTELNYIVTPTEIDFMIDKLCDLIAKGINKLNNKHIVTNN